MKIEVLDAVQKKGYNIIDTIGAGSFSTVFLALDTKEKKEYALKFVSREVLKDQQILKQFEREIRLLKRLDHPNIIKLYDVIFLEDYVILVEEYCKFGNLFEAISRNGKIPKHEILRIAQEILDALKYLHEKGISHRDIKPENIVFDQMMTPKLIDFGLCTDCTSNINNTHCGTYYFSAPEVLVSGDYLPCKCDIWSLGMTLYVAYTGKYPFHGQSIRNQVSQIVNWDCDLSNVSDPQIKQLLERMLVHDPAKRATTAQLIDMFPTILYKGRQTHSFKEAVPKLLPTMARSITKPIQKRIIIRPQIKAVSSYTSA